MSAETSHPLETVPAGESEMIDRVVALQLEIVNKFQDPKKRGQHPKQQALLRGTLEVSDRLPEALRAGIFARPGRFAALVRLSTGLLPKDSDGQAHGFAIKLLEVPDSPSGTQDFILIDQPSFFIRDVADYVEIFSAMVKGPSHDAAFYKSRPREFGLAQTFNVAISSHLERQYWSELPIAMDGGAARLTVIPDVSNLSGRPPVTTPDGLREALEDYFVTQRRAAVFHFGAQAYVDPETTPIEDATAVWPTPFETVATLTLPAQDFRAPEQYAVCESLSFTPWHCPAAHRPLGGIQRCRKRVYEESRRQRHELTGAALHEPTRADYDALGAFL